MSYSASVLYPSASDATFNMDYYLNTHMPLVEQHWGSYGLTDWKIVEFGPQLDGSKAPYDVQAILIWKDKASMDKAVQEAAGPVFGDVPNFSNQQPLLLAGDVKKSM